MLSVAQTDVFVVKSLIREKKGEKISKEAYNKRSTAAKV